MGILDFFKKKTTEASSDSVAQPAPSFSSSRKTSYGIVPIPDMISFGLEWRDKYLSTYAIKNNKGTRVEALMYSSWFVWYHCLGKGRVSKEPSYANTFFAHLMAHLQDDDARFEEVDFFMPIFQNRYSIFKTDLSGLINSHYPQTKQYLPIRTYKAFCLKPMQILSDSAASLSSLTMEQDDEMHTFVGKFISFINDMNKAVQEQF